MNSNTLQGDLRIPPRGDSAQDPEPEGSRGFKQAGGLFECAKGVKPLWKIATKWLILFVYHKHISYHHT